MCESAGAQLPGHGRDEGVVAQDRDHDTEVGWQEGEGVKVLMTGSLKTPPLLGG